jgi:hypothetical protein
MADEKEDCKKEVYIPQTAQDVQRMKIEKLMNNPVGVSYLSSLVTFPCVH